MPSDVTIKRDITKVNAIGYTFQADDQVVTVEQDVTISSQHSYAVYSEYWHDNFIVKGHLVSGDNAAQFFGSYCNLNFGLTSTVTCTGTFAWNSAVFVYGSDNSVSNSGVISSLSGIGIQAYGHRQTIANGSTIIGGHFGVFLWADGSKLINGGTIECLNGDDSASAVELRGGDIRVDNSGTISASGTGAAGIGAGGAIGITIVNSGSILSAGGFGIEVDGGWLGSGTQDALRITNRGLIEGATGAILADGDVDVIVNTGTINGDVWLFGGSDTYDGIDVWFGFAPGIVNGIIHGGLGDDVFRIGVDGAQVAELAGEGRDRIETLVSFDLMQAQNVEVLALLGSAALNGWGNDSDNLLVGNNGSNGLYAGDGYDRVIAGYGDDSVDGGLGEDQLFGGGGQDTILGGDGDDRITGGAKADSLTGGLGADVFYFVHGGGSRAAGHSGALRGDTIADFVSGQDRINLAAIDADLTVGGDQAFVFIGTAAFAAVAGQLRYAGGLLEADLDGDGLADMQFAVTGAVFLAVTDLSL